MCFLNILMQIELPLALIITSMILGRLSTRFWSVAVRIWAHSATRDLVRSGSDVR